MKQKRVGLGKKSSVETMVSSIEKALVMGTYIASPQTSKPCWRFDHTQTMTWNDE